MKRTILLDADVPAYQFAARGQKDIQWEEDGEEFHEPPPTEWAIDGMLDYIEELEDTLEADKTIICFSDAARSHNWRLNVLPTYKSNRASKIRPVLHPDIEAALADHFEAYRRPGLEGDDVLGILATNPKVIKGEKVICSIDKDMQTIPNRKHKASRNLFYFMNIKYPNKNRLLDISEEQADWYWMYQTLTGDTTDGYKGCPNIGDVKARKILGPPEDGYLQLWWHLVIDTYQQKGLTIEDALAQARVARIARAEDYDYKRKVIIPWQGV